MLITYCTIEDLSSGLFQTQIIDIAKQIIKQNKNIHIEILTVNRLWYLKGHRKTLRLIKSQLSSNIKIQYIPLLLPLRWALRSRLYSSFIVFYLRVIFQIYVRPSTKVVHARSYWPTSASLKLKNIPVIFDMRSLWVLENISMGNLRQSSYSHNYWMRLEQNCLQYSRYITIVSYQMKKHIENIASKSKIKLIPIGVDINKFKFRHQLRDTKRNMLSWDDKNIAVYSGSLGMSNVNVKALRLFIKSLIACSANIRILFLTMEEDEKIKIMLQGFFNRDLVKIIHPEIDEIGGWLSAADFGFHALSKQLDSDTRLGTKVVEYWASGLPVIVNENIGAAASLIKKHNLGAVIKNKLLNDEQYVANQVQSSLKICRKDISSFAKSNFSSKLIATKYLNLYRRAIKL
jgi:glycosyltransferase involved in cell wall biosynthesis